MRVWGTGEAEEVGWGHFMLLLFSLRSPDHKVLFRKTACNSMKDELAGEREPNLEDTKTFSMGKDQGGG